jgi:hypothetical protein
MMHFSKTQRGIDVLQDRSIPLTARQRRLLVLIGSQDFELLNDNLRQQLAPAELLDQLCALDLIVPAQTGATVNTQNQTTAEPENKVDLTRSEINRPVKVSESITETPQSINNTIIPITVQQNIAPAETNQIHQPHSHESSPVAPPELLALSFEDIKYMMMESLQKYCGLMAKQQIQHILHAADARSLKLCQMRWITSLQESRIAPQELNHILKQINFSLNQLQQNTVSE